MHLDRMRLDTAGCEKQPASRLAAIWQAQNTTNTTDLRPYEPTAGWDSSFSLMKGLHGRLHFRTQRIVKHEIQPCRV